MRKIKFRVWDKKEKAFIKSDNQYLQFVGHDNYFTFYPEEDKYPKDKNNLKEKLIIQQFTSLKDKNGREIYEGDILKQYLGPEKINSSLLWEVQYFEERASFGVTSGNCFEIFEDVLFNDECSCEIEIIGNIFENPELLKL